MEKELKWCDYGHQCAVVKRLDTSNDSGIFLCSSHWEKEMRWRKERNKALSPETEFFIIPF